ncbi:hypothetical protein QFC24_006693 [Naganishia onofrii]|uniref:Uncharacterized protein n=1 Tax=Naganishia onofrii TaxID=1851511 RepID=A0ACC2WYQ4_9TREE|nr:hypothetical protein QFC24_006693 [Naganishia onofrii]
MSPSTAAPSSNKLSLGDQTTWNAFKRGATASIQSCDLQYTDKSEGDTQEEGVSTIAERLSGLTNRVSQAISQAAMNHFAYEGRNVDQAPGLSEFKWGSLEARSKNNQTSDEVPKVGKGGRKDPKVESPKEGDGITPLGANKDKNPDAA